MVKSGDTIKETLISKEENCKTNKRERKEKLKETNLGETTEMEEVIDMMTEEVLKEMAVDIIITEVMIIEEMTIEEDENIFN